MAPGKGRNHPGSAAAMVAGAITTPLGCYSPHISTHNNKEATTP